MAAKPEEQADSEEEKKQVAEKHQFEETFDAIYYGRKRKKNESEEAAAAAEREENRKVREYLDRITADLHRPNSAQAGPLTKSEKKQTRDREPASKSISAEARQEKLFQEAQEDYNAVFDEEWDAFWRTGETKSESGTRDQEPASKSISETAAPRQQKCPRCFAA